MPLYEYECRDCGYRFEKLQKVTDRKVRTCPECKGRMERLASAPAIQFKGEGWYITDYSDRGKEARKAEKAEKGEGKKKESGGKESKESGGKESGGKDAGGKDSGSKGSSKDAGSKDSGSRGSSKGSGTASKKSDS